jgi:ribosomal protein L20
MVFSMVVSGDTLHVPLKAGPFQDKKHKPNLKPSKGESGEQKTLFRQINKLPGCAEHSWLA